MDSAKLMEELDLVEPEQEFEMLDSNSSEDEYEIPPKPDKDASITNKIEWITKVNEYDSDSD